MACTRGRWCPVSSSRPLCCPGWACGRVLSCDSTVCLGLQFLHPGSGCSRSTAGISFHSLLLPPSCKEYEQAKALAPLWDRSPRRERCRIGKAQRQLVRQEHTESRERGEEKARSTSAERSTLRPTPSVYLACSNRRIVQKPSERARPFSPTPGQSLGLH